MANKYWEKETPVTKEFGKNVFKVFREAGKIQCYTKIESAARGLSKGVTIDLQQFSPDDLCDFLKMIEEEVNIKMGVAGTEVEDN